LGKKKMKIGKKLAIVIGLFVFVAIAMTPLTKADEPATSAVPGIPDQRSTEPARHKTVTMTGSYSSPTMMNPFDAPSFSPGPDGGMFETLYGFNTETMEYVDCIAVGDPVWNADGSSVTIALNPLAEWSDGTALTAEDVVYSWELRAAQTRWATDMALRYDDMVAVEDHIVRFDLTDDYKFSRQVQLDIRTDAAIVPKHVWEDIVEEEGENMGTTFQNDWFDDGFNEDWMVISGPYAPVYRDATEATLALEYRGEDWWGHEVLYTDVPNYSPDQRANYGQEGGIPQYISATRFGANVEQDLAFITGDIDLFAGYMANIWEIWEGADEGEPESMINSWYGQEAPYQLAASTPMNLAPNFLLEDSPLGIAEFREALAYAIDYDPIPVAAASGYWVKLEPGWLVPSSNLHAPYINDDVNTDYAKSEDATKAVSLLQDIPGMTGSVDDGWKYYGEDVGPYEAICPTGWTDAVLWTQMASADITENLGIEMSCVEGDFETFYQAKIADDDFDFAMACCGNRASDVPERYLDYVRGESLWNKNISNWVGPLADEFDAKWNSLDALSEDDYADALDRMQEILAIDNPEIGGFVNGYWYAYSEWQWEGWANADDNFQNIVTTWTTDQFVLKTRLWMNLVNTGRKPDEPVIPFFGLELMIALGVISITVLTALRLRKRK
jgi:ABC-type transport system substrate-binding protein